MGADQNSVGGTHPLLDHLTMSVNVLLTGGGILKEQSLGEGCLGKMGEGY